MAIIVYYYRHPYKTDITVNYHIHHSKMDISEHCHNSVSDLI